MHSDWLKWSLLLQHPVNMSYLRVKACSESKQAFRVVYLKYVLARKINIRCGASGDVAWQRDSQSGNKEKVEPEVKKNAPLRQKYFLYSRIKGWWSSSLGHVSNTTYYPAWHTNTDKRNLKMILWHNDVEVHSLTAYYVALYAID